MLTDDKIVEILNISISPFLIVVGFGNYRLTDLTLIPRKTIEICVALG